MKILILNSGSSSLKYQFVKMPENKILCKGLVDKIGLEGTEFSYKFGKKEINFFKNIRNHKDAINEVLFLITKSNNSIIEDISEIEAVGHRVVHGGEEFSESVIINNNVISGIEKCEELAPLHNPANKIGILAIKDILPNIPQVAVFDTAFHHTIEHENYLYAIPYKYYTNYKIRKYGFHGTSHKYVSNRISKILNINNLKIINCHIGNGASIAAIKNGKVVDTSMGFTPTVGLVMGTRSGDLDPSIITFLMEKENLGVSDINEILNKKSGILGISEKSSDLREIIDLYLEGDEKSIFAIDVYINRIIKYIGSYIAIMGGIDVISFTAGVLENSPFIRKKIVEKLTFLGIELDEEKNDFRGEERIISKEDSKIKVVVIPTNEELVIAEDTYNLLFKKY